MSKSKAACEMTILDMVEKTDRCYLWTFTFREVLPLKTAAKLWSYARRDMVRQLSYCGVRVYEIHPGGHGLHIHVVTSNYYRVEAIRAICNKHGLGRIDVVRIPPSDACYVCKYLAKQNRAPCLKGFRMWGAIGDIHAVKVKNIVLVGHLSYCWYRARKWINQNMPIASADKAGMFHAVKSLAAKFYSAGDFEGYEVWRLAKVHFANSRIT